jgi:hypothetical protein
MTMRWPWLLGRPHVRVASRHVTSDRGRRTRALEKRAAHSRPDARYAYAATLDQLPALQEAMYSLRSDFLVVRAKLNNDNKIRTDRVYIKPLATNACPTQQNKIESQDGNGVL